jgi:SAM-dependent methyltransferase
MGMTRIFNFMSGQIISLQEWFKSPHGRYLLDWERAQLDRVVADIFGFHALQLGLPALDALQANRMPHRWLASSTDSGYTDKLARAKDPLHGTTALPAGQRALVTGAAVQLVCDFSALPFPANSLDLVVLPHTLELDADPHTTLREVERVLVPEGRVVICGVNPASLWGLRQRRAHWYRRFGFGELFLPKQGEFIGYWRLRDWLRLLSFEVESGRFGCYRPAVVTEKWLDRYQWMDRAGARWWPIFGAVYFLVAVKRVRGMRLIGPPWKTAPTRSAAPVSVANRSHRADYGDTD